MTRIRLSSSSISFPSLVFVVVVVVILVSTITASTTHASSSTFVRQQQHSSSTTTINDGDTFTNNRLLREDKTNDKTPPFDYLDSEAIHKRVQDLAKRYPQFTTLYTSQDAYGLPSAGKGKEDCPYDKDNNGCINWVLVIEDLISHEGGAPEVDTEEEKQEEDQFSNLLQSYRQLPEVLLSGCLHGNERVGPTTVVETATLLLEVVSCEASLHKQSRLYEEGEDNNCQQYLEDFWGVSDIARRWLSRLVSTRRIVIVPTANALGYYRNQREEDGIDPNRDFPFDLEDYSQCMQTVAARTLNEVFRDHLFQLSFTFHGGMEAIGYEWGAPSYEGSKASISPDDTAQSMLASRYSWYGGEFSSNHRDGHLYPYGDMNGLVYPVRGGMEDWAYGASWDKEHTQPCIPPSDKYGDYDISKTTYDESTLRVFNMLVETSNSKEPKSKYLGTRENLFLPTETQHEENGHVNRNIRLSLMLIDMVQPYLSITSVHSNPLEHDIIPSTQLYQTFETCTSNSIVVDVPVDDETKTGGTTTTTIPIEWTAGGAFDVDETYVMYGRTSDFRFIIGSCDIQPMDVHWDAVDEKLKDGDLSIRVTEPIKGGRTRWHAEGPNPIDMIGQTENGGMPADPIFRAHLELPITMEEEEEDPWMAIAVGTFDSSWGGHPKNDLEPQSHVVNARTNPKWYHESSTNGKMVVGRTKWISLPIRFRFTAMNNDIIETQKEKEAEELPEAAIPHITEDEEYIETSPEQHEQEAHIEDEQTQYEESVHSTETTTTSPNRDRAKEESAEQQSKSSSSWFHKSEGDEPVEEPPSLSLFHLVLFVVAAFMMMLAIQRIWTQKSSRKRRYRKTGRLPTVGGSTTGRNAGPSEFETVALASHEGSSVNDDTELDLEEFESENPFAHPDNEGEFVQVVASAGYHNQKVMHI